VPKQEKVDQPNREMWLNEAILAFLDARKAGSPLDRDAFLADYPGLEVELRSFLEDEAEVGAALSPWSEPDGTEPDTAAITSFSHYQVCEVINKGGMGIILRCRDRTLNRELAVKVPRVEYVGLPGFIE
jgi:hypothetical protein